MRIDPLPPSEATPPWSPSAWFQQISRMLAPQDWVVLGYCAWLLLVASRGEGAQEARAKQVLLSLTVSSIILWARGSAHASGPLGSVLYRTSLLAGLQLPYFLLRDLLHAATSRRYDEALYRLDLALFGVEPSLWLDRWVTPRSTEWFAFFYFSYFIILALHVLPILFVERRGHLAQEFAVGAALVFGLGQSFYVLVPGYGPHHHLEAHFTHALPRGFWMDAVNNAVQSSGAFLDIFPSLHTAGPLYVALFSFLHRDLRPFRVTWPVATFFSVNIIVATLFLRWHYAIDVLAGVILAASTAWLAPRLVSWDLARRKEESGPPPWPPLLVAHQEPDPLSRKR